MALTFLLTLNDINKPNTWIYYTECSQEVVSLAYVKRVKVIFWYPMAAILDCFLPPITQNNIKMDFRDKIQLKKWCFQFINLYWSFTIPGPLPSPAMELTGEDGREV